MHYSSNKFSGRRNSVVRFQGGGRQNYRQKSFDPTAVIMQASASMSESSVTETVEEQFVPKHSFSDFLIANELKANIEKRGYKLPTPIQDEAIPQILEGKDVVGLANTGTGKTAAFLIPLINKAFLDRSQRILIITPTRELANQIQEELRQFSWGMNIYSALCIGGVSLRPQIQSLMRNPQFVIGTPGRLKDLEDERHLNFSIFKTIVLDEVDQMLDIGFLREITHIISSLSQPRHSLFFSATLTANVKQIMQTFLSNPITISVKSSENIKKINQDVIRTNGKPKIEVLHELLIQKDFTKVLVFGRTKHGMEKLSRDLELRGFKVAAIHGNKNQNQRQRALNEFKTDRIQILLATDVASRGLDINDVSHVINYELPESYEDYIHRIGRTGRANKTGTALTFVD